MASRNKVGTPKQVAGVVATPTPLDQHAPRWASTAPVFALVDVVALVNVQLDGVKIVPDAAFVQLQLAGQLVANTISVCVLEGFRGKGPRVVHV